MKLFSKALIAILFLVSLTVSNHQARGQIVKQITIAAADDTLTNSDTALVTLTFDGSYKSVEAYLDELSGTTAGKIYFQGELPHGGAWENLDSLTLTDQAAAQYKLFTVPERRLHKSYRLNFRVDSTGTSLIKAYYIRYTGGAILRTDPYNGFAWNRPEQRTWSKYITNLQPMYDKRYIIKTFSHRQLAG